VHAFQHREAGHQPRRKRRLAQPVAVDGAEAFFEKTPIDRTRQFYQRYGSCRRSGRAAP
jgi:hypothetical protein